MEKAPPGPPFGQAGFDLMEDQSGMFVSSMIALIILSTSAVVLRLLSRKLACAGYWWDDVVIVIALAFSLVGPSLNLYAVKHTNFARHIWRAGRDVKEDVTNTLQMLWLFQIFFTLATCMIKLCILIFYRRIFPVQQLRIILFTIVAVVMLFMTTVIFVSIFQCNPIDKFWHPIEPGHCIDTRMNLYATGSINTALDVIIVFLPVPLLWQLRTSNSQKLLLTTIFLAAGFVCVVSILRLTSFTVAKSFDVTWTAKDVALWSAVEPCAGIISACMPSLRPLATIGLRGLGVRLPVLHRWSLQSGKGGLEKDVGGIARRKESVGWENGIEDTEAGKNGCRVENSLQLIESATQRAREAQRKASEQVCVGEMEVPFGEIRVETEIRWSVMQRYKYDYRVF